MKLVFFSITSILFFSGMNSFAYIYQSQFRPSSSLYLNGKSFCEKNSETTNKENGFYVDVPMSHNQTTDVSLKNKTTKIYAWFNGASFNPALPTVIIFMAGPGANGHGIGRLTNNYNELNFDMRGVGCSAPESFDHYINPNFYGYENTARDAFEIVKFLKLTQVSLFGISAGTIPTVIFSSLFPKYTRAAVTEASWFISATIDPKADQSIALRNLEYTYNLLTPEHKKLIDTFSSGENSNLFYEFAVGMQPYGNKRYAVEYYMNQTLDQNRQIDPVKFWGANLIDQKINLSQPNQSINSVDSFITYIMYCKEAYDQILNYVSKEFFLKDGKFTYDYVDKVKKEEIGINTCRIYNVDSNDRHNLELLDYKVSTPLSMLQGLEDFRTVKEGADSYFNKLALGKSQLLQRKNGAHNAILWLLLSKDTTIQNSARNIFEKLLNGDSVSDQLLNEFSINTQTEWLIQRK